jgi:putative glutamine amidotransferase
MTRRKRLAWVFPLVVLLLMVGCKDKSNKGRPTSTAPSVANRPERGGSDRPIIGLTSVYREQGRGTVRVNSDYIQSVVEAGGVPVVLPVNGDEGTLKQYVAMLDGLVLVGGRDVPPSAYGEKPVPQTKIMPAERYEFESELILRWLKTDKPLLGVCLGTQFVNVVTGGTLIQDISTQIDTKVIHRGRGAEHVIIVEPRSRLRKILGAERVVVNSSHHQAVGDVGRGLKVVARSEDGIIEALEMSGGRFCLLVQWHPERMKDADHRKAIFGALINTCKK